MMEALDKLAMPAEMREAVREAIARVIELAHPDLVILFGSWVQGRAREGSDVDLVIVAPARDRWQLAQEMYLLWHRMKHKLPALPSADIFAYTPKDFSEAVYAGVPAYTAVRHGVILHGEIPQFCAEFAKATPLRRGAPYPILPKGDGKNAAERTRSGWVL
jgi:predicted nucleotidyltransferase